MKTTSAGLQAHLDGDELTLAWLLKVTRADAAVYYWTTHDEDIVYGGATYLSTRGYNTSSIQTPATFAVPQLSVQGGLSAAGLGRDDVRKGLWDHAAFELALINYESVADAIQKHRAGWLGEIEYAEGRFAVELRGKPDALQHQVGGRYVTYCQTTLGSTLCGVALGPLTVTGSVTTVDDDYSVFRDSSRAEADQYFTYGVLSWTSGDNNGLSYQVSAYDSALDKFTLFLPTFAPIRLGDAFSVYPGCSRTWEQCQAKFSNGDNFQGYPHLPLPDTIMQVQSQR